MKRQNSLYRVYIALVLLTSFAATLFPFELFHTHNAVSICGDKNGDDGICKHKSHLGSRETYCWACTIHVEKTYSLTTGSSVPFLFADVSFQNISVTQKYAGNILHTSLRGPPQFAVA